MSAPSKYTQAREETVPVRRKSRENSVSTSSRFHSGQDCSSCAQNDAQSNSVRGEHGYVEGTRVEQVVTSRRHGLTILSQPEQPGNFLRHAMSAICSL
jgi:hypothetical protein